MSDIALRAEPAVPVNASLRWLGLAVVLLLSVAGLYGVWRFLIEYVRDDPERGSAFGFSTSQLISLAIVPLAAFFYYQTRKQHLASPQPVMQLGHPETYAALAPESAPPPAAQADAPESAPEIETRGVP